MRPSLGNGIGVVPDAPRTFDVCPCAAEFSTPIPEYMKLNPSISQLAVGAVVLVGDDVLLLQRASNDFAPLMWEVPGGSCEVENDATMLHSLSRELWEETGLRLRSVKKHIDSVEFDDLEPHVRRWRKITFQVEVEQGHELGPDEQRRAIGAAVKLDPAEHRDWTWARVMQVKEGKGAKGQMKFMDLQRSTLIAAFDAAVPRGDA